MALRLAIVGRPNVGKSTLFNRLAGRRLAIVHDRPGVTRDRREGTGRLGDLALELVDTAGLEEADPDSLEGRMRAQTEEALGDVDVVLFVVDARAGITPLDADFARSVRRIGLPVVLVVNKAEGRFEDAVIADAYALGLGEPIAASAEHGEGLSELYEALRELADARDAADEAAALAVAADADDVADADGDSADADPDEDAEASGAPLRLAFVGRPNVGKSTLANALLGEDRLLTGPEPGVTRDAVAVRFEWEGRAVRLHDTAGLRKRAKVEDAVERLSTADTIRAIRFAEVVGLVLNADTAFEKQDLQIADLVLREGRALMFVITKWDAVEDHGATLHHLRERAGRLLPQAPGAPIVTVSGLTGRSVDRILPTAWALRQNWSAKVKTRDLNDWLSEAIARHPPPAVNGRRIKPRYMTQTKARPPTFVLICSRADQLPEAYRRYLINGVREAFDLPAVPIRLHVRAGKNPYASGDGR